MGCASGKPQQLKLKKRKEINTSDEEKPKSSPQSRSQSTVDECDREDISVNRISILEQSCVGMKIFLQNECNQIMNQIKVQEPDIKANSKLEDKLEILKLLINLADEIQERSYQLFDKELKDEPKVEEYLISLIWACKKFRFKYTEDFLNKVEPLFQAEELNLKKVNVHLKKLISNLK
ncbi:hypothetical protein ABPG74_016906 [Tetrahymena malaccensis]